MSIRLKIILTVLPLIITTLLLTGVSSFFSASNGITGIAQEFLGFKAAELQKYSESQWLLLVENNLTERPSMVAATKGAIENYAGSIIRSSTELIVAFDELGNSVMKTRDIEITPEEREALLDFITDRNTELITPRIGGKDRVAKGVAAVPTERFRIFEDCAPPWYYLDLYRQFEQYGAVCVGSHYIFGLIGMWEEDAQGNRIARKTPQQLGIEIKTREDAARVMADWYLTKPLMGQSIAETRLALLDAGLPVLTYEADMADFRSFDETRILARLEAFMEGLGLHRLETEKGGA